jgi:hypothetical protein
MAAFGPRSPRHRRRAGRLVHSDDGAAAPHAGGGGGGSSDPPAGSDDGFRCRSHGVRAGSARIDRVGLAQAWRRSAMSHARRRLCEATAVQDCGHTAARRVLLRRRVRRSAAAGRCGTAGSSGAELGDGTQLRGARFGPHSLLCSHRALCSCGGPPRRSAAAVLSSCAQTAACRHRTRRKGCADKLLLG